MKDYSTVIGVDLGDQFNHFCVVDEGGDVLQRGQVRCKREAMEQFFKQYKRTLVAMEAGTHSPWVCRLAEQAGHEVLVANTRKVRAIYDNDRKSDKVDAEMLARLARMDPEFLKPIKHRGAQAQADLALLKARDVLVAQRTELINHIRGTVKAFGARLASAGAAYFHKKTWDDVPDKLRPALEPLYEMLEQLTGRIGEYERRCEARCQEEYTEVQVLRSVPGVGPITSLAFVLTLETPERFQNSRDVPAFLGLTPKRDQSGSHDPGLRISKAGNQFLRRLLVGCAQHILGPFGRDSALRQWGLKLAEQGGRYAKKRAVTAVARKLAVILHVMWLTGALWEPFPRERVEQQSPAQVTA